ncbi:MAG: hypothetical protein KC425_21995, partial [Anaerolineales bacterium]|nr:hypothetical protein [Anaerolineales bacterium]
MVERIESNQESQLRRALLALKEMRARLEASERARTEPIAILGFGCRFPGSANTPDEFWQLLANRRDTITEVPPDRWDADTYFDAAEYQQTRNELEARALAEGETVTTG